MATAQVAIGAADLQSGGQGIGEDDVLRRGGAVVGHGSGVGLGAEIGTDLKPGGAARQHNAHVCIGGVHGIVDGSVAGGIGGHGGGTEIGLALSVTRRIGGGAGEELDGVFGALRAIESSQQTEDVSGLGCRDGIGELRGIVVGVGSGCRDVGRARTGGKYWGVLHIVCAGVG